MCTLGKLMFIPYVNLFSSCSWSLFLYAKHFGVFEVGLEHNTDFPVRLMCVVSHETALRLEARLSGTNQSLKGGHRGSLRV